MEQKLSVENWVRIHSHENQQPKPQNDDHDEALSLCDLAPNEHDHDDPIQNQPQQRFSDEQEQDFAFSCRGSDSPENKMSSADELFFRGQILPLRHSVTLPSRFMTRTQEFTRSISSEPVSVACSRSSSQNSRTSLSSSTSASELNGYKPAIRNRNRNQFHSHPSPTPQIRTRSFNCSHPKSVKSLSNWGFLQLGPMKPQEIGLSDLRNRSQRSHGRGRSMQNESGKKKRVLSFSGCKCAANVVESTDSSRNPMVKPARVDWF